MPSCMASSFSQGDAFISSKPERTITFTSSPPRRREVRQQSIAVLPPPSTMTRLPILSMCPKETLDSQSMPIWMLAAASSRPGDVEVAAARRAGADEDGVVAFREHRLEAVDALAEARLDAAHAEDVADLLVDHRFGQAEARDLAADHAAAARLRIVDDELVAERREVARDGQRGGAGADQRDALAVPRAGALGRRSRDVVLVVGGDALQAADRDRLAPRPGRAGRPARRAGRRCGRESRERHWSSS